jgi:hypothetical protein
MVVSPNPFKNKTAIILSMHSRTFPITVTFFNARGNQVRSIAVRLKSAELELVWNGKDDNGRPCAAGVYFARVVSGEETCSRKVIISR